MTFRLGIRHRPPKPPVHFFAGERTKAGRAAHEQHNDADLHFIVAEIREILLAVEKQQRVRRKNDRIEADDFSDSGILLQDTCTDCKMMLHGLPDRLCAGVPSAGASFALPPAVSAALPHCGGSAIHSTGSNASTAITTHAA